MLFHHQFLRRATLLYLTLPLLIFLGGFLRTPLAVLACTGVGAGLWQVWKAMGDDWRPENSAGFSWKLVVGIVIPAAVLTGLSGVGGWGSGDSDWLKHDALLRDLLTRPWPVAYETGHGSVLLVYYTAFYLPAALLGKVCGGGWNVASQALALTTLVGIVLAGLWMVVLGTSGGRSRPRSVLIAGAVFFGFSGMDVVGKGLINAFYGLPLTYGNWYDIEWWAQFAQYSSNAAALFWAPQHAFGAWLPLGLVLDEWCSDRGYEGSTLFYLALALFWSPFAMVGLAPILGGLLVWRRGRNGRLEIALRQWLTLPNAAGVVSGSIFGLYLLAHFQDYPQPAEYKVTPGFLPMPLLEISHVPFAAIYVVFVLVEFAGLSAALAWFLTGQRNEEARRGWPLLILATGTLLLLPFLRYGYANDFVMRGSLSALFVLQVLLVRMLTAAEGPRRAGAIVLAAALLLAGGGNVVIEYSRHLVRTTRQGSWRDARTREPVHSLAELAHTIYARPGFDFTRQYLGSADSFFARHLAARRGALAPGAKPGPPDF